MEYLYSSIETQIVEALPELQPSADIYAQLEGEPGKDCGNYIFFEDMFECYVEVLLAMPASKGRDRLLTRALAMVEEMFQSHDQAVRDLAYIGTFELRGPWFYSRVLKFIGPISRKELDLREPKWRQAEKYRSKPEPEREIIDLYCTREVVLAELKSEGIKRTQIPGITYPKRFINFPSLEAVRVGLDGVVFLSCFGTTIPYVVCPPKMVGCDETTLLQLSQDLAGKENREPEQETKAQALFLKVPVGERVWNMGPNWKKHTRYKGKLWIADFFLKQGLIVK